MLRSTRKNTLPTALPLRTSIQRSLIPPLSVSQETNVDLSTASFKALLEDLDHTRPAAVVQRGLQSYSAPHPPHSPSDTGRTSPLSTEKCNNSPVSNERCREDDADSRCVEISAPDRRNLHTGTSPESPPSSPANKDTLNGESKFEASTRLVSKKTLFKHHHYENSRENFAVAQISKNTTDTLATPRSIACSEETLKLYGKKSPNSPSGTLDAASPSSHSSVVLTAKRSCVNSKVRWLMLKTISPQLKNEDHLTAAQWILIHCHKQLPYDRNWWSRVERQHGELSLSNPDVTRHIYELNATLYAFAHQLVNATAAIKDYIEGIDPYTNTLRKRDWNASTSLAQWISGERGVLLTKLACNHPDVQHIKEELPASLNEQNIREALHQGGILINVERQARNWRRGRQNCKPASHIFSESHNFTSLQAAQENDCKLNESISDQWGHDNQNVSCTRFNKPASPHLSYDTICDTPRRHVAPLVEKSLRTSQQNIKNSRRACSEMEELEERSSRLSRPYGEEMFITELGAPKHLNFEKHLSATQKRSPLDRRYSHILHCLTPQLNLVRPGAADTRMLDITLMDGVILPVRRSRCSLGIPTAFVSDPVAVPKICVYDFNNGLHLYIFYRGHKMNKRKHPVFQWKTDNNCPSPSLSSVSSPATKDNIDTKSALEECKHSTNHVLPLRYLGGQSRTPIPLHYTNDHPSRCPAPQLIKSHPGYKAEQNLTNRISRTSVDSLPSPAHPYHETSKSKSSFEALNRYKPLEDNVENTPTDRFTLERQNFLQRSNLFTVAPKPDDNDTSRVMHRKQGNLLNNSFSYNNPHEETLQPITTAIPPSENGLLSTFSIECLQTSPQFTTQLQGNMTKPSQIPNHSYNHETQHVRANSCLRALPVSSTGYSADSQCFNQRCTTSAKNSISSYRILSTHSSCSDHSSRPSKRCHTEDTDGTSSSTKDDKLSLRRDRSDTSPDAYSTNFSRATLLLTPPILKELDDQNNGVVFNHAGSNNPSVQLNNSPTFMSYFSHATRTNTRVPYSFHGNNQDSVSPSYLTGSGHITPVHEYHTDHLQSPSNSTPDDAPPTDATDLNLDHHKSGAFKHNFKNSPLVSVPGLQSERTTALLSAPEQVPRSPRATPGSQLADIIQIPMFSPKRVVEELHPADLVPVPELSTPVTKCRTLTETPQNFNPSPPRRSSYSNVRASIPIHTTFPSESKGTYVFSATLILEVATDVNNTNPSGTSCASAESISSPSANQESSFSNYKTAANRHPTPQHEDIATPTVTTTTTCPSHETDTNPLGEISDKYAVSMSNDDFPSLSTAPSPTYKDPASCSHLCCKSSFCASPSGSREFQTFSAGTDAFLPHNDKNIELNSELPSQTHDSPFVCHLEEALDLSTPKLNMKYEQGHQKREKGRAEDGNIDTLHNIPKDTIPSQTGQEHDLAQSSDDQQHGFSLKTLLPASLESHFVVDIQKSQNGETTTNEELSDSSATSATSTTFETFKRTSPTTTDAPDCLSASNTPQAIHTCTRISPQDIEEGHVSNSDGLPQRVPSHHMKAHFVDVTLTLFPLE